MNLSTIGDLERLARDLWGDAVDALAHAIMVHEHVARDAYYWERYHGIEHDLGGEG